MLLRLAVLTAWLTSAALGAQDFESFQQIPAERAAEIIAAGQRLLRETAPTDRARESDLRCRIGCAMLDLQRFDDAAEQLALAAELSAQADEHARRLVCLGNLAVAAHHLGRFAVATKASEDGLRFALELGATDAAQSFAINLGATHVHRGDYPAAVRAFDQALRLLEGTADQLALADCWNNIAVAHLRMDSLDEAARFLALAEPVFRAADDDRRLADAMSNRGDVEQLRGNLDAALELHGAALELRERSGAGAALAMSYHSLGSVQHRRGESTSSIQFFERALELRQRLNLRPELVPTLNALAEAVLESGDAPRALALATRASQLATELQLEGGELRALDVRAEALLSVGLQTEAIDALRQARRKADEIQRERRGSLATFQAQDVQRRNARQSAPLRAEDGPQAQDAERAKALRNYALVGTGLLLVVAMIVAFMYRTNRRALTALDRTNAQLQAAHANSLTAMARIDELERLLPICSSCKNIRDDRGAWHDLESYLTRQTRLEFTHGICPDCVPKQGIRE